MAMSYALARDEVERWRVTLTGKQLVCIKAGWPPVVQRFEDEAAAREHLALFAALRRREGYLLTELGPEPDLDVEAVVDPLFDYVHRYDDGLRLRVTLRDGISPECMGQIFTRVADERPTCVEASVHEYGWPGEIFGATLAGMRLPSVRSFILDTWVDSVWQQSDYRFGDAADILSAFPCLERAFMTGDLALRPTHHASLRELYLRGDPIRAATLDALGRCALPALEALGLVLRSESKRPGAERAAIVALSALCAPRLTAVHIDGMRDVARFLDELAGAGLPASLRELCLGGSIVDEDALLTVLARRAQVLRSLDVLALPILDEVSSNALTMAREIIPAVVDRGDVRDRLSNEEYDAW
jgi:hypothetical protein